MPSPYEEGRTKPCRQMKKRPPPQGAAFVSPEESRAPAASGPRSCWMDYPTAEPLDSSPYGWFRGLLHLAACGGAVRAAKRGRYLVPPFGRNQVPTVLLVLGVFGCGRRFRRHRDLLRRDFAGDEGDVHLVAVGFLRARLAADEDGRAGLELPAEHVVGERVLDIALDCAAQRPGAHRRVVALVDEQVLRLVRELDRDLVVRHLLAQALQQQVDDRLDLFLVQLVEDDDLVDAVEQLGAEDLLQLAHDAALHLVVGEPALVADREAERLVLRDRRGADVRGHDHDRVPEVDAAPLGVGQLPLLQDLEQDVEHVRVCLLDLVEEEHRVRLAAHGLGQLAAFVVPDVARRRADEPRHGVLLHVLRHVDLDERVLVAEEELGERARELGLADAGRAEEDERAGRPLRILDAGASAADRLGDGDDRLLLADDALVQLLLHADEPLRLRLGELEDRDARPHRDDVGDLLLAHLGLLLEVLGAAPLLLELALLLRELALLVAQRGGLLEFLGLDRGLLLLADAVDLLLQLAVTRRRAHRADADARRGLVDEVDRLVGEMPVLDVAVGELGGRVQRLVGDLDAVMRLVPVAQPAQDLHGVVHRRLLDAHLLEAALERCVALEVLAVLVERRRADRLQLAAGESRLEDRRRVDRALSRAGADEIVQLVDEENDVAPLHDLLHDLLQALLELAGILRARDERSEVERVDLLVLQQLRHLVGGDARSEPLDDGGLADAGLADQHGVVLRAARQDLHEPLDLRLAADDRVELALGRLLRQVAAELVEELRALRLLARGTRAAAALATAGAGEHADDLVADLLGVGVEVEQDARGDAFVLAHEPEQDVLGADVVVSEGERLAQRELEDLLRARRERDLPGRHLVALADNASDLRAHLLDGDVERLEHARGKSFFLAQQPEQDVLGADVVVLERARLVLGEDDDLTSPFGEAFEHLPLLLPFGSPIVADQPVAT